MATIRETNTSALLVIDVQNGAVEGAWNREKVIANVAAAVELARAEGAPVIWVQHADEELVEGTEAWRYVPELVAAPGEPFVHKHYNSAFEETDLEATLARLGVSRLVLAGLATNWCVRATAFGALDRGYDCTIISDAHTTSTLEYPDGHRIEASDIVREFNTMMQWERYPGRTNAATPLAEVRFRALAASQLRASP